MTAAMRAEHPRCVLFDLDGTLLDTGADLAKACDCTLRHFGFAGAEYAAVCGGFTSGMRQMLRLGLAAHRQNAPDELIDGPMREYFAAFYTAHIADSTVPFPSIPELTAELSAMGITQGVVTNKYTAMARSLLSKFEFSAHFSLIQGGDETPRGKPYPDPLLKAAGNLGLAPADILYVGDHPSDIQAARAAGICSCAASWGYGRFDCGSPDSWDADMVAKEPREILKIFF